jgi:predicted site-specific integrase-resolvase
VWAAIYARVSTTDQKCEMQLAELREYVSRRAWELAGEYVDTGWSGLKASRPEFDRLMRDAGKRIVDVILCWKLDRFGRSLLHCMNALEELQGARCPFYRDQPGDRHRRIESRLAVPPSYPDGGSGIREGADPGACHGWTQALS